MSPLWTNCLFAVILGKKTVNTVAYQKEYKNTRTGFQNTLYRLMKKGFEKFKKNHTKQLKKHFTSRRNCFTS